MNIHLMSIRSDLSLVAVMEAIKRLNDLEADGLNKGVRFVELEFAPDMQMLTTAEHISRTLLKTGMGIKLSVHWPFSGTLAWAVKTENSRVVNEGLEVPKPKKSE